MFSGEWMLSLQHADGGYYEPDTITGFHRSVDRYVGQPFSLVSSAEFDLSRRVLQAKRKELKGCGMGNKPNQGKPLDDSTMDKLWEIGQLGLDLPEGLLNLGRFNNTTLLSFCSSHENRQLKWGDLQLANEINYLGQLKTVLIWTEQLSKTHTDGKSCRKFVPKIYPNLENESRCPIKAYFKYKEVRPESMSEPDSPFYLAINHKKSDKSSWFKALSLGVNKLGSMLKRMLGKVGIHDSNLTNHSVRKTAITNLLDSGVDSTKIVKFSGHKNVSSIANYATVLNEQQCKMSHIWQRVPSTSIVPVSSAT